MTLDELNELDFNNIGDWPILVKAIVVLLLCVLIAVGGYYLLVEEQYINLESAERTERDLRSEFETKQAKAANLEAYRAQLAEMQETFGAMLRQLPNKTEVAALLVDVSQTGLASGLEFELFQPQNEQPREFYSELPIRLRVKGQYHEFGNFVSGLSSLPRIVTIFDVSIAGAGGQRGRGNDGPVSETLTMTATAKTYRYLDEEGG